MGLCFLVALLAVNSVECGDSSVYEFGCFAVVYLCFVDCSCVLRLGFLLFVCCALI